MKKKWASVLTDAVMNNQLTKVARLLTRGVNPNICEDNLLLYSPLHYAAAHGGAAITILLLDAGADLEAKDVDGDTPLRTAWLHRNKAFIRACQQRQLLVGDEKKALTVFKQGQESPKTTEEAES